MGTGKDSVEETFAENDIEIEPGTGNETSLTSNTLGFDSIEIEGEDLELNPSGEKNGTDSIGE